MESKRPGPLPEHLPAEIAAEGDSASTGGKRIVYVNKEYGVQITVTWMDPNAPGVMAFKMKAMPLAQFRTYEEMRKAWAAKLEQGAANSAP